MKLKESLDNERIKTNQLNREVSKEILKMCINQIKSQNSIFRQNTIYMIPPSIFGKPSYDVIKCAHSLMKTLKDQGMECYFEQPCKVHISWAPPKKNAKVPINNRVNFSEEDKKLFEAALKKK